MEFKHSVWYYINKDENDDTQLYSAKIDELPAPNRAGKAIINRCQDVKLKVGLKVWLQKMLMLKMEFVTEQLELLKKWI